MTSVKLREKANFTRLSKLLVDKGSEALRITLDSIHPPAVLPGVLNARRATLLKLKPRVIDNFQWDLLFPPSGNPPDSKTFDVTLLTVLLRNICGLSPPATGWNTMPPVTDISLEANITRIKLFRNEIYAHVASTEVDNGSFEKLWLDISKTLLDLKIPQKELDDLKIGPLGPEEQIYGQIIKEFVEDYKSLVLQQNLSQQGNSGEDVQSTYLKCLKYLLKFLGHLVSIAWFCICNYLKLLFYSILFKNIDFFIRINALIMLLVLAIVALLMLFYESCTIWISNYI